jgi:Zn-dependent M28 family amino/carboxypeptidase
MLAAVLCATAQAQTGKSAFSGATAMQYTKSIVAFGPRYNASEGKARFEGYLKQFFAQENARGWLETDTFVANTPAGPQTMRNYIVRYPGTKPGAILISSHYETNYPLRNTTFVGANDGACTSAILMEMANHLRQQLAGGRLPGYGVWLVFFDGEEAVESWTHTDSLYGSRHLAAKLQAAGQLGQVRALLVADMIGDRSLNVLREQYSTPWLLDVVYQAAASTGHAANFFKSKQYIEDDHLPFVQRGVPVADVIDMDYGPHDAAHPDGWHHTPEDTVDKLSVKSLQASGEVLTETVRLLNQR